MKRELIWIFVCGRSFWFVKSLIFGSRNWKRDWFKSLNGNILRQCKNSNVNYLTTLNFDVGVGRTERRKQINWLGDSLDESDLIMFLSFGSCSKGNLYITSRRSRPNT